MLGEIAIVGPGPGPDEAPLRGSCQVMLRPEQLELRLAARGADTDTAAEVLEVQYLGHDALAHLRVHGDGEVGVDRGERPGTRLARAPGECRKCRECRESREVRGPRRPHELGSPARCHPPPPLASPVWAPPSSPR